MVFLSPGFDFMTINGTQGTLLYLKWITNRDLLCSTGNCAQCYVVAWMGGEFWGEWVCVYVWVPSLLTWNYHSILAWRIPWTEEPGGLQSMGSQRIGHHWACTHITTLFISYTPIQDKRFKINKWYPGAQWLPWWFELNFWHLAKLTPK